MNNSPSSYSERGNYNRNNLTISPQSPHYSSTNNHFVLAYSKIRAEQNNATIILIVIHDSMVHITISIEEFEMSAPKLYVFISRV